MKRKKTSNTHIDIFEISKTDDLIKYHRFWELKIRNFLNFIRNHFNRTHNINNLTQHEEDEIKSKIIITKECYNNYLQFFLNNLDFAKRYISLNFPFSYNYLIENWEFLEPGEAHYSVYIIDESYVYSSRFGIVYNKNIRWNSKLKAKFDCGFINYYEGTVEGTGKETVEVDERDYLDDIIPLDKKKK